MVDRNFEIGGRKFKLCKIDAMTQFHIVRRMTPMLNELLPVMGKIAHSAKAMENSSEIEKLDEAAKIFGPVLDGLSRLSDKDADHVLFGLLSSVELLQSTGNWARVASGSTLMFQDLELPVLLQAAGRAFAFNLSSFFTALPRSS